MPLSPLCKRMVYLLVMIVSASGIIAIVLLRTILRSRNARRIVHSVRAGFLAAEKRNAKWLPDTPLSKEQKSPRTRAIELQEVRTLLRLAEKSLAKLDAKGAERALIQALTIQPAAKDVKVQLAKIYLLCNKEPKAEALYHELLKEHEEPALHANLGLACYKQEKYVEACQAYQKALNLDPKNPARCEDLGKACIAAHRFEEAAPLLEKASASSPRDIDLLHLLARCFVQIGDAERAGETYRRINKLDPRDEDVKTKLKEMTTVAQLGK